MLAGCTKNKTLKYFGMINRARVTSDRKRGDPGPKHLVGGVISRTEGELTFQHNQRSKEYYLRGVSKKAEN